MVAKNDSDVKRFIKVLVPGIFTKFLVEELARSRGLEVNENGRGKMRVDLFCSEEEADALLREAAPAGNVLYLLQLEAVVKSLAVIGEKPTQEFLDKISKVRSKLGVLAARI